MCIHIEVDNRKFVREISVRNKNTGECTRYVTSSHLVRTFPLSSIPCSRLSTIMPDHAPSSSDDETALTIPGYKFWIEIDGKRAEQYQVEHSDDVVSCYIASEVDKEFTIVLQKQQREAMSVEYYFHDDCIRRLFFKPEDCGNEKLSHTRTERGIQRFAFSSINFTDDERMGVSSVPENLGMIRLMLYPVYKFESLGLQEPNIFDMKAVSTISEKTKAVGFHSVSLRPPEKSTQLSNNKFNTWRTNPTKPWYTIRFVYRPLVILQAQGIAPESDPEDVPNDLQSEQDLEKPIVPKIESTERKPPIQSNKKAYRMETSQITKTIETIIIEDSDSEDDRPIKTEKNTGSKRPRVSHSESVHNKRRKTDLNSNPEIIVLDSD